MLLSAFAAVFQPMTFLLICGGVMLGIIFGAIPGMSATMAVALCLPISFGLEPVAGISLLIGLYRRYFRRINFSDSFENSRNPFIGCNNL